MPETYYDRLGITADATVEDVERAFRTRLKATHPDVSDDPDAGERTKALIEARDVLTDAEERARYDRLGHERYVQARDEFVDGDSDSHSDDGGTDGGVAGNTDTRDTRRETGVGGPTTGVGEQNERRNSSRGHRTRTDRTARHAQNEQTRAAWNTAGTDGSVGQREQSDGAREWHAWDTGARHRVYPTDRSTLGRRLFPPGPSLLLLLVAFALYPVMLWAALTPAFPLAINVTVGLCILLVVAFLQSMPSVGIAVFGTWSVLLPALVWFVGGVPLLSPVWLAALGGTVLPLGLSGLTLLALRH